MATGIYKIVNLLDGKTYVGQALKIGSRWRHHRSSLRLGRHINSYLQNAWNKYGETLFSFEVIQLCSVQELDRLEQYWWRKLSPEYNMINPDSSAHEGHSERHKKWWSDNPEHRSKLSERMRVINLDPSFQDKIVKAGERRRGIPSSESADSRASKSTSMRELWKNPEFRAKMLKRQRTSG